MVIILIDAKIMFVQINMKVVVDQFVVAMDIHYAMIMFVDVNAKN